MRVGGECNHNAIQALRKLSKNKLNKINTKNLDTSTHTHTWSEHQSVIKFSVTIGFQRLSTFIYIMES